MGILQTKGMQAQGTPARTGYLVLGLLFAGLGYIGAVTPVMPSTVFFLLALWAFKRSSPRLEAWLLHRSFIGPVLRDWERDRSISLKTKAVAITLIVVSVATSCWVLLRGERHAATVSAAALLVVVALAVSYYIWTRKTREPAS